MAVDRTVADDLAASISNLYIEAERRLAADIARRLNAGMDSPTWAADKLVAIGDLRRWTNRLLGRLETDAREQITQAMVLAYTRGGTEAIRELGRVQNTLPEWINRAGIDPGPEIRKALKGERAGLDSRIASLTRAFPGLAALQRVIGSLVLKIAGTHLPVLRWAVDSYRAAVAEGALAPVLLGTAARRAGTQRAWERLLSEGITGFVDKGGRRWNLATYVEMATRTGVAQAAVEGHLDRLADADIKLVVVSNAPQECERCRPWEGKVLARGGPAGRRTVWVMSAVEDELVEVEIAGTVDEAIAKGLMHPNCRHSLSAYLPGATRIPTNTEDPEGDAARQKLRALERKVRKAKLEQAGALTPEAAKAAEDKIRAGQAAIREHVKDTKHLGIMRKREREQTDLGHTTGGNLGRPAKQPKPTPTPMPATTKPAALDDGQQLAADPDRSASLQRGVKSGVAEEKTLSGGDTAETRLVTFTDGSKAVSKRGVDADDVPIKHQMDAEQLASSMARLVRTRAPAVYRAAEDHVYMTYVDDARTAMDVLDDLGTTKFSNLIRPLRDTDEGRRLGLLDLMLNNADRHEGNWMLHQDGGIVAIDHGHAWLNIHEMGDDVAMAIVAARGAPHLGDFVKHFVEPSTTPWLNSTFRDNDLTPTDVRYVAEGLADLRDEFVRLGREIWYEFAQARLAEIMLHAKGTTNRIAP